MDFHVELVKLLKHADVEGKKLTWNLYIIVCAATVKLIWIKAETTIAAIWKEWPVSLQAERKRTASKPVKCEKE